MCTRPIGRNYVVFETEIEQYLRLHATDGKCPGSDGFAVYYTLCRHASKDNRVIMSLQQIADGALVCKAQAAKILKRLTDVGALRVHANTATDGGRLPNTYTLLAGFLPGLHW
jgi:hypothetical protein